MSPRTIRINGQTISELEYTNTMQGFSMDLHRKTMDQLNDEELDNVRDLTTEKLVARELIYQEALSKGIVADEDAVATEKKKLIANFPTEEEFYSTLERAGIDALSYHRMLRKDLTVNKMTDMQTSGVEEPSDDEVKGFFALHSDSLAEADKVRAQHILLRTDEGKRQDALDKIEEIREKLADEEFGKLAQEYSACPSRMKGGDLGFFQRGDMVKPFEEAAFSLEVGQVSEPVETQFGLHLIKIIDQKKGRPLTFEESVPRIRRYLKDKKDSEVLEKWVMDLKDKANIEISD